MKLFSLWTGFGAKNAIHKQIFQLGVKTHKTKIAFPDLKECSNQKIEENRLALRLNFTLKCILAESFYLTLFIVKKTCGEIPGFYKVIEQFTEFYRKFMPFLL